MDCYITLHYSSWYGCKNVAHFKGVSGQSDASMEPKVFWNEVYLNNEASNKEWKYSWYITEQSWSVAPDTKCAANNLCQNNKSKKFAMNFLLAFQMHSVLQMQIIKT